MKNALFYGLLVLVIVILGVLAYGIYLNFAAPGADPTQAVCGAAFVILALVVWEFLMKPGYHRRRAPPKAPEKPEDPQDPRSP
jgi:hypothetical protein